MPLIEINPHGVSKDTSPLENEKQWTEANNIRFRNSTAQKMAGEILGTATTGDPTHLLFSGQHNDPFWIYMGDGIVRATDYVTDQDLDTANNVSTGTNWDSTLLNLIPVLNNTIDAPWTSGVPVNQVAQYSALNQVTRLPGFPANTTCQAIRPYRDFLFALNITDSGNEQPNRIIWSDASDSGALPPSWDITDPTTLAGDAYLTSTVGEIIDGLTLRDFFVIYKQHSITLVRFTGGRFVMSVQKSQINSGLLAKDCVTEYNGRHFIVADGDIMIFDGQNLESIAEDRVRREIFDNMDTVNFRNTYVARFDSLDEIWVCYPTTGQTWANKAAIWNYADDTWTFKDLGEARHIYHGITSFTASPTYDSFAGSPPTAFYDSSNFVYNLTSANPTNDSLAKATSFAIHNMNEGFDNLGVAIPSLLEKDSMDFGSPSVVKLITKIIPKITAVPGTEVHIRIGTQFDPDDVIVYQPEQIFTVGTSRELSTIAKGKYISIRLRTDDVNAAWRLHSLELEVQDAGRF